MGAEQMPGSQANSENLCKFCSEHAIVRLYEPERRLCAGHLTEDVERRVFSLVREENMIHPCSRIAVGLSGGKDSAALLIILKKYVKENSGAEIVAVTIDEGIEGYREETLEVAEKLCRNLNVEHHIISFEELFGKSLDEIVEGQKDRACSICGVLRRRAINEAAKRCGATAIATGHNLDDEAQSVLMNTLRGDLSHLSRNTSQGSLGIFLPRIKPLSVLSEKEITVYLLANELFTSLPECPYAVSALRSEVRTMIADLEYRYPGTKRNLIKFRSGIMGDPNPSTENDPGFCSICGERTRGDICRVCSLLESDSNQNLLNN
jgi:uncharacterized protein (TIGR00269 family)